MWEKLLSHNIQLLYELVGIETTKASSDLFGYIDLKHQSSILVKK